MFSLAVCAFMATMVYAADGFVINKVDDNGDPVEGAVFDVDGKPVVTFEEIPDDTPETTTVTVTKKWDDSSDKDGVRPDKIELILYRGGEPIASHEINAKDSDSQTYTFTKDSDGNDLLAMDESGEPYTYFVREDPSVRREYTPSYLDAEGNPLIDANGAPDGGTIVNTYVPEATQKIKVGMKYRAYSGGSWGDVVASAKKVTVSGESMSESKTLSFTPGSEAQEVELPGEGTYTIAMTAITKGDLKPEDNLLALTDSTGGNPMPLIIDTVSATVTVDEDGNCTVDNTT